MRPHASEVLFVNLGPRNGARQVGSANTVAAASQAITELVSVGSFVCAACSSESIPAMDVCCLAAEDAFIWPAPGSSPGRAWPAAVSTALGGDLGEMDKSSARLAATSAGAGVSVGDRSAASIDAGVVSLLLDGIAGLDAVFCWLDAAEVRLTLRAGFPSLAAAEVSAVATLLLSLLRRLEAGDAADERLGLSDLPMLAAARLCELPRASLAALTLLPTLMLLVVQLAPTLLAFFCLPSLSPSMVEPCSARVAAFPLAASRLLTLSCSLCMISECVRSVPAIGAEPRSDEKDRVDRTFRDDAGARSKEEASSICILATPTSVVSAAASSETPRTRLCASASAPELRLRSSGVKVLEAFPAVPGKGEGGSVATEATDEEATDVTVSAVGERKRGDLRCEACWKRHELGIVGDS